MVGEEWNFILCRGVCSDEDGTVGPGCEDHSCFLHSAVPGYLQHPPGPRSGCVLGLASKANSWNSELMPEGFGGGRRNGKKIESRDNYARDI